MGEEFLTVKDTVTRGSQAVYGLNSNLAAGLYGLSNEYPEIDLISQIIELKGWFVSLIYFTIIIVDTFHQSCFQTKGPYPHWVWADAIVGFKDVCTALRLSIRALSHFGCCYHDSSLNW